MMIHPHLNNVSHVLITWYRSVSTFFQSRCFLARWLQHLFCSDLDLRSEWPRERIRITLLRWSEDLFVLALQRFQLALLPTLNRAPVHVSGQPRVYSPKQRTWRGFCFYSERGCKPDGRMESRKTLPLKPDPLWARAPHCPDHNHMTWSRDWYHARGLCVNLTYSACLSFAIVRETFCCVCSGPFRVPTLFLSWSHR